MNEKISQEDVYCNDVSTSSYFGRVPIGESAKIGDYGELGGKNHKRFIWHGNITDVATDFNFETIEDDELQPVHFWMSKSITKGGLGGVIKVPGTKASIDLAFNADGAAMISLNNAKIEKYKNLDNVGNWLVNYYNNNHKHPEHVWKKEYALVSKVVKTEVGTILVASSKGQQVTIEATLPDIPLAIETAQIGVTAGITSSSGGFTEVKADKVAPLMGLIRLEFNWLGDPIPKFAVRDDGDRKVFASEPMRLSIGWEELDPSKDLTSPQPPSNV